MKERVFRIYSEAFGSDPAWNRWFFNTVYREEEAMMLIKGGNAVSTLMLQSYRFRYAGQELPMAYISGAATSRQFRGKGHMSELMGDALRNSYDRGDAFASLIPANRRLFCFYEKFGFATVFFTDRERYTSMHVFTMSTDYTGVPPTYEGFARLERMAPSTVVHSERDYVNIIWDIAHDNGTVKAVADTASGETAAMAFAVAGREEITVKELLAVNDEARETVLAEVRSAMPELPMVVCAPPADRGVTLSPRGMIRIIDAHQVLRVLAEQNPRTEQVIRIHDDRIPENNGVYIVRDGRCEKTDHTIRHLTLDTDISTLAGILFSAPKIGDIFGLPSCHPMMQLMLD